MGFVLQFDARGVVPAAVPEPVPSAIYTAALIASEEKPAKTTPGATYYEMISQILDGEFKGRKITDRLNCKNPNQQAVDIAYATLSAICHVTGVLVPQNSAELHGKPYKINVAKVPRNDDPTRMTNEIRGYLHMDGSEPGKQGQANGAAAAAPVNPAFSTAAAAPAPVAAFQPAPAQQFQPAPTQQFQPAPAQQPAPAPVAAPAPVVAAAPVQPVAQTPVFTPVAEGIWASSLGGYVNAQGQAVNYNPQPAPVAAAPIPQQFQPAATQQFAPAVAAAPGPAPATPSWAQ